MSLPFGAGHPPPAAVPLSLPFGAGHPAAVPLWIDCDPGHDDAFALWLAAFTPRAKLLGVSTLYGNSPLGNTTRNARRVLALAGHTTIPVAPGAAKPLLRPLKACEEIHGESGLEESGRPAGEPPVPEIFSPLSDLTPAVVQMHAALTAAYAEHGRATLVCTGALTNAALLLSLYPEMCAWLKVVWMGGSMAAGNTQPVAEFNAELDPEAAAVLFTSGVHLTMVPLDVTHTAIVTSSVLARVRAGGDGSTRFRRYASRLLLFFAETYARVFAFKEGPPLHDPCAVLAAVSPELFTFRHLRVDIEVTSPLSFGQTVCDVWGSTGRAPNVHVATGMFVPAFWDAMLAALEAADAASPLNEAKRTDSQLVQPGFELHLVLDEQSLS